MKPKKRYNFITQIRRRIRISLRQHLTASVSSPKKFTKEVIPNFRRRESWASWEDYSKDKAVCEVICTQLYQELGRIVRNLILAQDDLRDYREGSGRSKEALNHLEIHLKVDLIKLWGFLKRFDLRPLNSAQGVEWGEWLDFLEAARLDRSILDHLEPARVLTEEEEVVA